MNFACRYGCTATGTKDTPPPRFCEPHNEVFRYTKALSGSAPSGASGGSNAGRVRKPLKRSEPKRDWSDARAKVEQEGCCRICKRSDCPLEAAHVLGREHDEPKVSKATGEILKELYVHPARIVPLCGPFPEGCHGDVDYHRVNLLHHLTIEEQVQVVRDADGIAPAWRALAPVDHRKEVEEASV
jgi:hypothetical protein